MDETSGTSVPPSFGSSTGTSTSNTNIVAGKPGLGNARSFNGSSETATGATTNIQWGYGAQPLWLAIGAIPLKQAP